MRILASLSFAGVNPEFVTLRIAGVVDVAPLSYPPHFLKGGVVSPAFYEGTRQLGSGTIPIKGPAVPDAYP